MAGNLEVVTGCMFSGKTDELLRRLNRLQFAHQKYLLFKPTIDDRYGQDIVATHDGKEGRAFLLAIAKETLRELKTLVGADELKQAQVVAFDEAQFFSGKFPWLCERLVKMGKRVIVAGLDLDFRGRPFGPMPKLLALADEITKLTAVCTICGREATRTQRLVGDSRIILVGGKEFYEARCREHWRP